MAIEQRSLIETLSFAESADLPVMGTLIEQIAHQLNSDTVFSDIIIHQNSPIMLRQPKRLVAVSDIPVTLEEMEEFFEAIEPDWEEKVRDRAFDRSKDLHSARIRLNCFTFQGKKRLGCVIRRFPTEPIPLGQLGLRKNSQEFAWLHSGLVLIIGDTCQGKSPTIASLLDEMNKTHSRHISAGGGPGGARGPRRGAGGARRGGGAGGDGQSGY